MARFTVNDVDNYGGKGGSGFFFLRDDGDVATVRFLYNSVDDIDGRSVHLIYINDKKRYLDCPREYNEPVEKCPFCKAGKPVMAKLIIPVYDESDGSVKLWERGKSFFSQMTSICERYGKHPIVTQTFDIERQGVKGSKDTKYMIYRTDEPADNSTLDDFDKPNIVGPTGFILQKSTEDMEFYLDEGYFPPDNDNAPVKRSSDEDSERPRHRDEGTGRRGRRTPANEDVY